MSNLRNLPTADGGTAQAVSGKMAASRALAQPLDSPAPQGVVLASGNVGSDPPSKAPLGSHPLGYGEGGEEGRPSAVAFLPELVKNAASRVPPQLLNNCLGAWPWGAHHPKLPRRLCGIRQPQEAGGAGDPEWTVGIRHPAPVHVLPQPARSPFPVHPLLHCLLLLTLALPGDLGEGW